MLNQNHKYPGSYSSLGRSRFSKGKTAAIITALSLSSLSLPSLLAQDDGEEIFELSPFTVEGSENEGYRATSTLAGTRIATSLKDVGASISVYTKELLEDVGATDNESLLVYGTSTEVGGTRGNFTGVGNGASVTENQFFARPNNNTRVRGLTAADNTRNYFASSIPFDSYNSNRVDIVRGPNAILFGLGSPAGIINNTTTSAAFSNSNEIQIRNDRFGSLRTSLNVNRELVEGKLAVRVALLNDDRKYQQNPAYSDSQRIYLATKWNPELFAADDAQTSITASYEKGNINSNRPRMMTPQDQITPFFKSGSGIEGGLNGMTIDQRVGSFYYGGVVDGWGSGDIPAMDDPLYDFQSAQFMNGYVDGTNVWGMSSQQGNNRNPWFRNMGNIYDGFVAFSNSNGSVDFQQTRERVSMQVGHIEGLADGRWAGISNFFRYAELAQLPMYDLGVYKNRHLADRGIFDYQNNLLDGSNKREFNDFEDFQAAISQTFLGGDVGIEIAFDHQTADWGQESLLQGNFGNSITIDVNEVRPDGSPNPNLGRAAVTSNFLGGNNVQMQERDQFRTTAFYKLDLEDRISGDFLGKLFGQHTFTGFMSTDEDNIEQRDYARYAVPEAFATGNLYDVSSIRGPARSLNVVHYISDDLRGQSWPTGLQPISGTVTPKSSGTLNFFDQTWNASGVDPDAMTFVDPFFPRGGALAESENPANYVGWNDVSFSVLDSSTNDINSLYTRGGLTRSKIKSEAFVWQGHLWGGAIVPMFGYREDDQRSYNYDAPLLPSDTVDLTDSSYMLPSAPTGSEKGTSKTHSLVVHVDELVGELPGGVGFSVFFNESENFQPAAARINHLGQSIASPSGSTEDYGFQLTSKDQRFSIRVNKFETNVKDATLVGGGFTQASRLGWSVTMPWAYAMKARNEVESFQESGWNPEGGYSNIPEITWIDGSTLTQDDILGDFFNYFDSIPQEFRDTWNLTTSDDQWQINGWLAGMGYQQPQGLSATVDNVSKGTEIELTANPTRNWSIMLNAAKTTATRTNVGGDIARYVEEINEVFKGPAGAVRLWGPGWSVPSGGGLPANAIRQWFRGYVWGDYSLMKLQEGSDAPEIRKWRMNLITNYNVTEGKFKGMKVGGSARYQSSVVTGYPVISNPDPDAATPLTWDIANPYKSGSDTAIDLWVGYKRPINDRIDWRVQLNVTDAFANDELIPISVQPDGSYGAFRMPATTSWFLTNTFDF